MPIESYHRCPSLRPSARFIILDFCAFAWDGTCARRWCSMKSMSGKPTQLHKPTALISNPAARASSPGSGSAPKNGFSPLVPELAVSNLEESLSFWCGLLGFEIAYDRPAARFAYLVRGQLQVMLCERNGRWEPEEMQRPYGRGINLQMTVGQLAPILDALKAANWPLYEEPKEAWYRTGDTEGGQREFLVQDPDGYLLRFAEVLGRRLVQKARFMRRSGSPSFANHVGCRICQSLSWAATRLSLARRSFPSGRLAGRVVMNSSTSSSCRATSTSPWSHA
jgi:catechol 2,3-dioxygenase-like lactoylglutathione lyase family enzyme